MHELAVGIDVGGSGIRAALVDAAGARHGGAAVALAGDEDRAGFTRALRAVLADLDPPAEAPVGISVPGFADAEDAVRYAVNVPGLDGARPADLLGSPVTVVPDLAAAALAESRAGSGRGVQRLLCVAIGTGANAALAASGRVVETAYGCLGDAGHVIVEPDGPPCACGGRGCLEAVTSGLALARDGASLGLGSAAEVVAAARAGRPEAVALLERAGAALGRAMATWAVMTFPDRIAVGGGVAAAGPLLLEPAEAELRRVGTPYVVARLDVVPAELGREAATVGAGLAALVARADRAPEVVAQ